jgi:hypothetical protein
MRLLKIAIKNSLVEQGVKKPPTGKKLVMLDNEESLPPEDTKEAENPFEEIEEMKTYYPTEEQFREPMRYIEYLTTQEEAHKFGTIKIVPPSSFRPILAFDMFSQRKLPTRY